MNALRNERGDLELVRGVLECLVIAVQPGERESHRQVYSKPCASTEMCPNHAHGMQRMALLLKL